MDIKTPGPTKTPISSAAFQIFIKPTKFRKYIQRNNTLQFRIVFRQFLTEV